ncbi:bacteriohemerythrin [Azonexus fungiphilus]|uniref:bacteriohemerythrin n=1 Tax=Azonexus fungiphilus TaxID=146940 RepID=UPI00156ADF6B|nr:bacteriohemerythrin [Azonexus fungiphilus]NHC05455.1 bacteriohemerythrin [Azonexus fungiphilus]
MSAESTDAAARFSPAALSAMARAMDSLEQGHLWLDPDYCVLGYNRAYELLLGIRNASRFIGRPFAEVLRHMLEQGEFFDCSDHEQFIGERMASMAGGETWRSERVRPNGTVLSITGRPQADGGYLYSYVDITGETRALEEVRRNAKATVVAIANFSEHRDTDTGAHVLRVARLVGQTARRLQQRGLFANVIDDTFIDYVSTASILHDVGKIAIPDRILFKAGPLTDDERETMKQHALAGAKMLEQACMLMHDSRYLQLGSEIALTHHEWYDGSGYPAGLAGDAIPVSGRICALADVFDALTSRRPYKQPWSTERAVAQIRKQVGSQFDPLIADIFLEVIEARDRIKLVTWQESMSVGNVHIDEQHQILIDTINQLASAEIQNDRTIIAMIIDELVNYTVFHFKYEEQLIEAAGYPDLEKHRRIHQGFVRWVKELREEFTYHRRNQLGVRILGFLRDWLQEHILGEDQRYRDYIDGVEPPLPGP